MRDLSVQAANDAGVSGGDKNKLDKEFQQLKEEIGRIIGNTDFNGKKVLQGSIVNAVFQVGYGTDADNQITVNIGNLSTTTGIASVLAVQVGYGTDADNQITVNIGNLSTTTGIASVLAVGASIGSTAAVATVRNMIDTIDAAIESIDTKRSDLGAIQNRFSATINNLANAIENQSAARSRILDADFAVETANLSRSQILQQAGTSMLAQANQAPQSVLGLLG